MSENCEKVCEICSQAIPGNNEACASNRDPQNTDRKSVICNQCSYNFNNQGLTIKIEEFCIKDEVQEDIKPLELVGFHKDIPMTSEVPCESNLLHCFDCVYSTISKKLLIKHVKSHKDQCGKKEFSIKDEEKSDLKQLELVAINTDIPKIIEVPCLNDFLYCFDCGYSTISKKLLIQHVKSHKDYVIKTHRKSDYSCGGSNSSKRNTLKHTGEKPYKCKVCDYSSSDRSNFKRHTVKHTGEKPYKCKVCDHSCRQYGHLKLHMHTHTGEKPYKCKVCDYSFSQSGNLKNHMRTHTGEKPYKCKVCDYSCTRSGNLKNHMRTHTGEKPYKCKVCDYSCGKSSDLKRHMLKHTGVKPYKCNLCNYSCGLSSYLKQHVLKHTGEKPYKCKVCDYSCRKSGNLKKHMLKHTGEKPYQCNHCDYSCVQSDHLKRHMLKHDGEKP